MSVRIDGQADAEKRNARAEGHREVFRLAARGGQEASGVNGVRRSRQNHRSRFLPTVVRGCRTFTYHADGQLASASIDALGNRTTYAYDQFGNPASVTDPLGNAIFYEYDVRGRKTYEGGATYPVRCTYDIFGNRTTMMTYRNESLGPDSGDVTTWLYDEASGCMTNKVYADGKGPTYGIFNVEIEDYYEWVKDDGAMDKIKEFLSRLASSAYDAAVYMQKNCGNKSFGHKESFSLECNGCCE